LLQFNCKEYQFTQDIFVHHPLTEVFLITSFGQFDLIFAKILSVLKDFSDFLHPTLSCKILAFKMGCVKNLC